MRDAQQKVNAANKAMAPFFKKKEPVPEELKEQKAAAEVKRARKLAAV